MILHLVSIIRQPLKSLTPLKQLLQVRQSLLRSPQRFLMILILRLQPCELQIIHNRLLFFPLIIPKQSLTALDKRILLIGGGALKVILLQLHQKMKILLGLQRGIKVINNRLDIARRFLITIASLKDQRFIMQYSEYNIPIQSFPTAGSIFKYFFTFPKT